MIATIERRLISQQEVATKLGCSKSWIAANWKFLKSKGFPDPLFGGGHGSPKRWDNRAIDLWFDTHLPENLLETPATARSENFSLEHHLANRAKELFL